MFRVIFCAIASVWLVGCVTATTATAPRTEWNVRSAEGLDAILFVGALTGDKLQSAQYPEEIAKYRALLTNEERAALDRLGAHFAKPGNGLAGPRAAFHLADAPDQSYEGIKAILASPEEFYGDYGVPLIPPVLTQIADYHLVYTALERIGFVEDWRKNIRPVINESVKGFEDYLADFDIIPLHEQYLGRDLDHKIDVVLLHYNRPYGIRVFGQRFATYHGWSKETTLQTAAHEIFHPPFDDENPALISATARLKESALLKNIVATTDPAFGYSTFESILDEDSTQALDMVVSLRFGLDRDPGEYWTAQDDGMHLLAVAIYDAMIETGFAETGGVYEDWLINALSGDVLSPEAVERRARKIVGDAAVDKWLPKAP